MASTTEVQVAEARAAAVRQRPDVIVHQRTTADPYQPGIEVTPEVDVLELLDRGETPEDVAEDSA